MQKTPDESPTSLPAWLQAARTNGLLSRLPDGVVTEMVSGAQRVDYPAGGVGLRWDEDPKSAIVLRGTARAFLSYPDGNQTTTRYLKPGDMSGVFAPRTPRIARGIQALETCQLLIVEAARMRHLSMTNPAFAWALIEEMTTILNATHRALYVRAFASVRQRVAITLVERARLSGALAAGQTITGTQSDLAAAAGTVREVVATALHGLKREGIVDIRRAAVVILDPERLAREADDGLESRDADLHAPRPRPVPLA